jgi:ADP-ribosylation factor related protein 1
MYLKIWDVGGQMSLRRLWQSYYKSAHAVIFVVDSTDLGGDADLSRVQGFIEHQRRKSSVGGEELPTPVAQTPITPVAGLGTGRLDECRRVLESVLEHEETVGIPILVLANKQDREDCVEVVRIKEGFVRRVFEGEQGGMVRDSRVLPVSALKGTGVKEAVDWVRSRVVWNKEIRPPVMR